MANPSYYQTGPVSQEVQEKEHLLHLYMYQRLEGSPDGNQKVIVNPNLPHLFGCLAVNDWAIYDGILPNANLVARAQGHHIGAGSSGESWTFLTNFVFVDKRFLISHSIQFIHFYHNVNFQAKFIYVTYEYIHFD